MARFESEVQRKRLPLLVRYEYRVLISATLSTTLGLLLWVIAISTDYWFYVESPHGVLVDNRTQVYFLRSHSGLWKLCRTELRNESKGESTIITTCHNHRLFVSEEEIARDPELDATIMDYTRTEMSFAVISLCLMVMGICFSVYTFKENRYTFKRLAGGVHFITAASTLVVLEVVVNSVNYEAEHLAARHPLGAEWSYGYSIVIAWISFSIYIFAGCCFIACSRKRKGHKAQSDLGRDDEPQILGRI